MGHMPDISEYVLLSWFEWVWYREQAQFLDADWLGVAMDAGHAVSDSLLICGAPSGSQEAWPCAEAAAKGICLSFLNLGIWMNL